MHTHVYLHNFRTVDIWDNPVDDDDNNNNNGALTLCHSYLKPYCTGRKTVFFFSRHLIYILKQEHFRAFRPAGDI
jgi:hypothetical protein